MRGALLELLFTDIITRPAPVAIHKAKPTYQAQYDFVFRRKYPVSDHFPPLSENTILKIGGIY